MDKLFSQIILFLSLILIITASSATTNDELKIESFKGDNIILWDENRTKLTTVNRSVFPPDGNITIVDQKADLDLIAIKNKTGETVWIDRIQVISNWRKGISVPVIDCAKSNKKNERNAGTHSYGNCH